MPGIYEPVSAESIRLLHLRPARRLKEPLAGTLETVLVADNPSYQALSYAWAGAFHPEPAEDYQRIENRTYQKALPPSEIDLDGSTLTITGNLGDALRRLRLTTEKVTLWVDAICINQDDHDEKSFQVGMMARIYSAATQVVIWFGEDSADRDGATFFRYCEERTRIEKSSCSTAWREALIRYRRRWGLWTRPSVKGYSRIAKYLDNQEFLAPVFCWRPATRLRLLKRFNHRRYFSRRWCVQELVLAKQILLVCGPYQTSGLVFEDVTIFSKWLDAYTGLRRVRDVRARWLNDVLYHRPLDLFGLLEICDTMECSDERDHLYALASLLQRDTYCPAVKIRYDIPWQTVYLDFARNLVAVDLATRWNMLVVAAEQYHGSVVFRTHSEDVPSWAPDWRMQHGQAAAERSFMEHSSSHAALNGLGEATVRDRDLVIKLGYFGTMPSESHSDDFVYGLPSSLFDEKLRKDRRHLLLRPIPGSPNTFTLQRLTDGYARGSRRLRPDLPEEPLEVHEIIIR